MSEHNHLLDKMKVVQSKSYEGKYNYTFTLREGNINDNEDLIKIVFIKIKEFPNDLEFYYAKLSNGKECISHISKKSHEDYAKKFKITLEEFEDKLNEVEEDCLKYYKIFLEEIKEK